MTGIVGAGQGSPFLRSSSGVQRAPRRDAQSRCSEREVAVGQGSDDRSDSERRARLALGRLALQSEAAQRRVHATRRWLEVRMAKNALLTSSRAAMSSVVENAQKRVHDLPLPG